MSHTSGLKSRAGQLQGPGHFPSREGTPWGPSQGKEGSTYSLSLFFLKEKKKKTTHDATCSLGIFQHNCLKIAWAITAQFLFRKGFSSPACPGGPLRKRRLGQQGLGRGRGRGATGPLPLLRPGPPPVSHLPRPGCQEHGVEEVVASSSSAPPGGHLPETGPPALGHFSLLLGRSHGCPEWLLGALISPSGLEYCAHLPFPVVEGTGQALEGHVPTHGPTSQAASITAGCRHQGAPSEL